MFCVKLLYFFDHFWCIIKSKLPKLVSNCEHGKKNVQRKKLSSERVERHAGKLAWGRKLHWRELFVWKKITGNANTALRSGSIVTFAEKRKVKKIC